MLSTAFIRTLNIAVQITMLTVPEYNINAKQREFAGHTGRVFDVDISNDGLCVTASEDGTAKVWRLADGRLEGQLAQSESKDEVLRVAWAPRPGHDGGHAHKQEEE